MNLLFDIGGTRMRFALSQDNQNLQNIKIYESIPTYSEAVKFISSKKDEITLGNSIENISGGIAGVVVNNVLFKAPHLEDWDNKPFAEDLKSIFNVRDNIYITNDASVAALGEATKGAGKDYNIVAYITFGTGVGGAKVLNKKIETSKYGFEPGHQIINFNDKNYTTLEELASGSGLQAKYGIPAKKITDKSIWNEVEKFASYGLNNVILLWSPEVIILGGGLINNNRLNIEKIENHLSKIIKNLPTLPIIQKSQLGEEAGLYGALFNLNNKL